MNTEQIIIESNNIENELMELNNRIKKLNTKSENLQKECPHEIVFKYKDNHPRKINMEGIYICPACGKKFEYAFKNQYLTDCFRNSLIIPLMDVLLIDDASVLKKIREDVLKNTNFYYNCKDINSLRIKMEDALKDCQETINKKHKIFGLYKKVNN